MVEIAVEQDNIEAQLINEFENGSLFEFLVDDDCPAVFLGEHNALPREIYSVAGEGHLVAEIPASEDVSTVIGRFLEEHPDAELVAKREQPYVTPMFSHREFRYKVTEELTDREREILDTAHELGYYCWPRRITAEELAEELGISSATLHKHLRAGEQKLISVFFDGPPVDSP